MRVCGSYQGSIDLQHFETGIRMFTMLAQLLQKYTTDDTNVDNEYTCAGNVFSHKRNIYSIIIEYLCRDLKYGRVRLRPMLPTNVT